MVNKHLTQRGKMNHQNAMLFLSIVDDSSSSSSEESDDNDARDNELIMHVCNILTERRDIPRIGTYLDVVMNYDDQEFRRNFRLTRGYVLIKKPYCSRNKQMKTK